MSEILMCRAHDAISVSGYCDKPAKLYCIPVKRSTFVKTYIALCEEHAPKP